MTLLCVTTLAYKEMASRGIGRPEDNGHLELEVDCMEQRRIQANCLRGEGSSWVAVLEGYTDKKK